MALTADVGRIVSINHQIANIADSMAMAGASEFTDTGNLNAVKGRTAVEELYQQTITTSDVLPKAVNLSAPKTEYSNKVVSVTLNYKVTGMIMGWMTGRTSIEGSVLRSAKVCNPNALIPGTTVAQPCPYPL